MKVKVGKFSIDGETLSGPADYMEERGDAKLDAILNGTDVGFNAGLVAHPLGPSPSDEDVARRIERGGLRGRE